MALAPGEGVLAPFRARASRWALVWAVAFAVVAMHHLGTSEQSSHPMAGNSVECCEQGHPGLGGSEQHAPTPGGQHDVLHLCLAVLGAVVGLGLILLALHRRAIADMVGPLVASAVRPRSPPPPPRGVPERLAILCVLRL